MGLLKSNQTQEYRLLMIQPDPESGESLCVGIVFQDDVVYDAKLSRLKCISPAFDLSVARFYLSELREAIKRSRGLQIQQILAGYAPILRFSPARMVASPVTDSTKAKLLTRFVLHETFSDREEVTATLNDEAELISERQAFSLKLRKITSQYLEKSYDHVIENARSSEVLGRNYPGIGKVALALKRLDKVIVMDGVDLQSATPKKAITQSTRVVHTFWQYKRIKTHRVTRVAFVFKGGSRGEIARDAHDFVLDHFQLEADRTIDGSSLDVSRQLSDFSFT